MILTNSILVTFQAQKKSICQRNVNERLFKTETKTTRKITLLGTTSTGCHSDTATVE